MLFLTFIKNCPRTRINRRTGPTGESLNDLQRGLIKRKLCSRRVHAHAWVVIRPRVISDVPGGIRKIDTRPLFVRYSTPRPGTLMKINIVFVNSCACQPIGNTEIWLDRVRCACACVHRLVNIRTRRCEISTYVCACITNYKCISRATCWPSARKPTYFRRNDRM